MKKILCWAVVAGALAMTACSEKAPATYNVTSDLGPDAEGLMAYIVDYDTGDKIDSLLIGKDGIVTFTGNIDTPLLARLIVDGNRRGVFILEEGHVVIDPEARTASGTPLNDRLKSYTLTADSLETVYEQLPADSAGMAARATIKAQYDAFNDHIMKENLDNPLGYMVFLQQAYEMDLAQLDAAINANPSLARYKRVNTLRENLKKAAETAVGKQYKDFAVEYNDSTYRLSDHVGKDGAYTLVDFWASWCGPCIKETATIKKINEKWGGKGLNVVGVAVWDEPDNTLAAVEAHNLPWPQIVNAASIPTDLYGISGIPCIILIDPQGKIVSRGLQGAELEAAVDAALTHE